MFWETSPPQDHIHRVVTVLLDNCPLDDLLGYVVQQTNLKCSIEGDTVYLRAHPATGSTSPADSGANAAPDWGAQGTENPKSVVFDQLDFEGVDVKTVLQVLADKSKNLVDNKKGIHFSLRLGFQPIEKPGDNPVIDPRIHPEVTLKATNISLVDVLNQISTETGLKYSIFGWGYNNGHFKDYRVAVWLQPEDSDAFAERTYWVPRNFFSGPTSEGEVRKIDVRGQLENRGLRFPDGASATFFTESKGDITNEKLVFRNTIKQLDLMALLLDQMARDDRTSVEIKSTTSFYPF